MACLVLLKIFFVFVSRKSFLKNGCEYGCLSNAYIAEFLELSLRVTLINACKTGDELLLNCCDRA